MNGKQYFYKRYENLSNPICSKVLPAFDLTQAVSLPLFLSLYISVCVYYDLWESLAEVREGESKKETHYK
jgi:hypothetical protein